MRRDAHRPALVACLAWVLGFPLFGLFVAAAWVLRAFAVIDTATPPDQREALLTSAILGAARVCFVTSVLSALGIPALVWALARRGGGPPPSPP